MLLAIAPTLAPAQTNSKEIMARPPAELVELLKNPGASVFEKAKACQRLAVVGTKDAVPALAALLPDEHLNLYARFGLEGIPDPAVDEALREAATKLQGRQLVGVIDSIGQRRDRQAVELLSGLLGIHDDAVASAAAGALGRIGSAEAAERLLEHVTIKNPTVQTAVADACLTCAEHLAATNKKEETEVAGALYAVLAKGITLFSQEKVEIPKHIKVAALRGLFRLKTLLKEAEAKDLLLEQVRSQDKAFFNVGLAAAREMPGADVTAALAAEVEKLPPERQSLLLLAIGDRKDSAPHELFLAASKNPSASVREAAIRVLVKHGDASAVAVLLDAALGDAEIAQTAKDGLKSLPGRDVDAAIVARLAGAQAKAKLVLLDLIGARQIVQAMPPVREATADANEPVRLAAIAAFAQLADVKDLDLLIEKALAAGNPAETAAARTALKTAALRMGDRDGCAAKLAGHLKGAGNANQAYLLDLLCKVSGVKALEAVVACAKSSDPAMKDAATRTLGEWVNADAAPALLDIAKNDPDTKYQIRALRGYIRIARQLEIPWWTNTNAAETKLAMLRTAMEVAKRDEEKRLALDILTRIPSSATLAVAVSYVGDPALKDAAADAAVKIAAQIHDPKSVAEAMQKVLDAGVNDNLGSRAKQLLGQAQAGSK